MSSPSDSTIWIERATLNSGPYFLFQDPSKKGYNGGTNKGVHMCKNCGCGKKKPKPKPK